MAPRGQVRPAYAMGGRGRFSSAVNHEPDNLNHARAGPKPCARKTYTDGPQLLNHVPRALNHEIPES